MPKQLLKIDQFHGGLNSNSNPRDIADNELSNAIDIMVTKTGVIKLMPGSDTHQAGIDDSRNTPPMVLLGEGTGLFTFSHDRKIDGLIFKLDEDHPFVNGQWIGNQSDFTSDGASVGIIYDAFADNDPSKIIIIQFKIGTYTPGDPGATGGPWFIGDYVYVGSSATDQYATNSDIQVSTKHFSTPSDGENYIAMADANDASIYIWDEFSGSWKQKIDLGSLPGLEASFYSADGAIRVADGNHSLKKDVDTGEDLSNKPQWYGYIERRQFGDGVSGRGSIGGDENDINTYAFGYPYSRWWSGTTKLNPFEFKMENSGDTEHSVQPTLEKPIVIYFDTNVRNTLSTVDETPYYRNIGTGVFFKTGDKFARFSDSTFVGGSDDYFEVRGIDDCDIENFCEPGDSIFTEIVGQTTNDGIFTVNSVLPYVSSVNKDRIYFAEDITADSNDIIHMTNLSRCGWWDSSQRYLQFAMSTIYDEKQESSLYISDDLVDLQEPGDMSVSHWADYDNPTIGVAWYCPVNNEFGRTYPRVSGFNIYVRKSFAGGGTGDFYKFAEINITKGLRMVEIGDKFIMWDSDAASADRTQVSPLNEFGQLISLGGENPFPSLTTYTQSAGVDKYDAYTNVEGWKTAVVANRIAYLGNIKQNGRIYGDRMVKSLPNQFDTFPDYRTLDVSIEDGDSIVKLNVYADRILQFKKTKMHLINISQEVEFLEETFVHKGISTPAASCETDYGIAWANEHGVYLYDGEKVTNLFERKGVKLISEDEWRNFLLEPFAPVIGYLPLKRQIIVNASSQNVASATNVYLYDIVTQSWVRGMNNFATFVPLYQIIATPSPGYAGRASGGGMYALGAQVTLNATFSWGYQFVNWTNAAGVEVSTSEAYVVTVQESEEPVEYFANFIVEPPWRWIHNDTHDFDESDDITYHYAGTWSGTKHTVGSYYQGDVGEEEETDVADNNLAHHNWLFSPNQFYDKPTDRTYLMAAIEHTATGSDGWENTIGYYDHATHTFSHFYGTGAGYIGGTDQHALGAFTISEDESGDRFINVLNPLLWDDGGSSHNGPMIAMRSRTKIDTGDSDAHIKQWNYICHMGVPETQHGNGFDEVKYHLDYPHIYNCDANGTDEPSVMVLCSGFGGSRSSTNANRNCIMAYRSIDAGLTWCDFGNQFPGQPLPYGCSFHADDTAETGIWGCEEAVSTGVRQNCAGYKVIDLWDGSDDVDNFAKVYFALIHGKGKIGLAIDSGMDGDSGNANDTVPAKMHKDMFYIASYNGYVFENAAGTWKKNVINGIGWPTAPSVNNITDGKTDFDRMNWITTVECGWKQNKMWIASSRGSRLNGVPIVEAFNHLYGLPIDYTPQDLRSSTAWQTREEGGHNDYKWTVGNYEPVGNGYGGAGNDPDLTTGIKAVMCFWGMHFNWQGEDNILLHMWILDMQNGGTAQGHALNAFGQDRDRGDIALVYYDFTAGDGGNWAYRNDGRGLWGQKVYKSDTTDSYTLTSGPHGQGMFHQQYDTHKHEVFVQTRKTGLTINFSGSHTLSVGQYIGNAADFTSPDTIVSLVVQVPDVDTVRTYKLKVGRFELPCVGYSQTQTDWASGDSLYYSDKYNNTSATQVAGVTVSGSPTEHTGTGRGDWILRFNTTDFFDPDTANTILKPNGGDPADAVFFDTNDASDGYGGDSMMCLMTSYNNQDMGLSGEKEMLVTDWVKVRNYTNGWSKLMARIFKKTNTE